MPRAKRYLTQGFDLVQFRYRCRRIKTEMMLKIARYLTLYLNTSNKLQFNLTETLERKFIW